MEIGSERLNNLPEVIGLVNWELHLCPYKLKVPSGQYTELSGLSSKNSIHIS